MNKEFLPISKSDLDKRGWGEPDIVIITGDAYVDHPSYGTAVIGRVLEDAGFKVGIIAQPDWRRIDDFVKLGKPRLFFGITAGNLDSMVANYTANRRPRKADDFSPGGKIGLRPDRAAIVYTNRVKEAFPDTPIAVGGIEASLRRFAHYDYWSDSVRRSILADSKADILVYGMGEAQILEIARRLNKKETIEQIPGTVIMSKTISDLKGYIMLPSFEEASGDNAKFNHAIKTIFQEADPFRGKTLVQAHGDRFVVQFPPVPPLKENELDRIYLLNYARNWHPIYEAEGGVPGFETVRFSIISHRGCPGECTFCSLSLHQGRIVESRSEASILEEIKRLSQEKLFKGTLTDIGGPTANLYKTSCKLWKGAGACKNRPCLIPKKCEKLKLGYNEMLRLLAKAKQRPGVKHVFIGSGFRHDLLVEGYSDEFLKTLCASHISGQMKVAPEHCSRGVLTLMKKPLFETYEKFVYRFKAVNKQLGKKQYLVNYFIVGHPGCTLKDALALSCYLIKHHLRPEQVQDFIPLPLTISGAMYYTETDPFTARPLYVAKLDSQRKMQRALIQYYQPKNKRLIAEALKKLGRMDLRRLFHV